MKKTKVKLPYVDYTCQVGERVQWKDMADNIYEGVLIKWLEDNIALIELPDKSTVQVQC